MKKILSLFVAVLMCLTMIAPVAVFAEDTATYAIGSVVEGAKVGDIISLPITLTTSGPVNSIGMNGFTYDAEMLEFVGFANHDAIDAKAMFKTWRDDMKILSVGLSASEKFDDFKLCDVQFKVLKEGTTTVTATGITKNNSTVFTPTVTAGTVTVASATPEPPAGDVATYTFGSSEGAAVGDTISISLALTTSGPVNSIGMNTFTYDAEMLEFVGFVNHDAIDAKAMFKTWKNDMKLLSVGLTAAEKFDAFKLCDVQFKVLKAGTTEVSATGITKNNSTVFTSNVTAGTVTVEEAVVEPETYDVVFMADGEVVETITKEVGQTVAVSEFPAVPAKQYYDGAWDVNEAITEAKTVNAVYTRRTFVVTFVADGTTVATKTVNEGEKLAVANFPAAPAKEGYTVAWDVTTDITAATTVTAVYTEISTPEPPAGDVATYTFGSSEGAAVGDVISISLALTTSGPVNSIGMNTFTYDAEMLEFVGFVNHDAIDAKAMFKTWKNDMKLLSVGLTAAEKFDAFKLCDVQFKVLKAGTTEVSATGITKNNSTVFTSNVTAGTVTVEEAVVEPETYDVVFMADGEVVKTITKEVGQTVAVSEFPAVPAKQYYDGAWDVNEAITEAKTVNAVYTRRTFEVKFVADGATVATKTVNEGEALAVANFPAAPAKEGYTVAWDVTTDITAATTVTAVYTEISTPEPPAGDVATYTFGSSEGAAVGDVISISLALTTSGPVNSIGMNTFTYDAEMLEFVGFVNHDAIDAKAMFKTWKNDMKLLSVGLTAAEKFDAFKLCDVQFKVLKAGTTEVSATGITKNNSTVFTSNVTAGTVTVEEAVVEPETYDVVFMADGVEVGKITKEVGQTVAVSEFPAVPAKQYYDGAWDVNEAITEAKTVNAVYTRRTFEVKFVADGATVATKTVNEGEALAVANFPAAPAKEGYTVAWDVTTDITAATTVTAVYTEISTPEPPAGDVATYTFGSSEGAAVGDVISISLALTTSGPVNSIGMNTFTYDAEMLEFVGFVNHDAIDAKAMFKTWKNDMKLLSVGLTAAEKFDAFKLCDVQFKVLKAGTTEVSATGITKNNSTVFTSNVAAGTVTVDEAVVEPETYTVTFVADGVTVGTIVKEVGQKVATSEFPAVPAKAGFAGAWDVTTDITGAATVTAVYTAKVYGDIDGDGEVATLVDLMTLERHLAHWIGYDEIVEINADLDEDGFVTVIDVMILAKHIADWNGFEELPCK